MNKDKRGPGRPIAPDGPYDVQVKIRVAQHQRKAILDYASKNEITLSELFRGWIDQATLEEICLD